MTTLAERQEILERFRDLLTEHRERIATSIARENGKVWREANAEAGALIAKIGIAIEAYQERTGYHHRRLDESSARELVHRPLGVMAVFGPYNFPMHLPNGHIVPALLAGNTVVFKPSEHTPMCGELLVALLHQAGVPEDVVQVVQGARETGLALTGNRGIHGVLFTGSYATGRAIHHAMAGRPEVMLALEMGGNNPLIVHEVEDPEAAAAVIIESAFATTGQRCTCARRLLVPEGPAGDQLVEALVARMDRMRVGGAFDDPEPYMGPLIHRQQAERVEQATRELEMLGGRALRPARLVTPGMPWLRPALLDMTGVEGIPDEEIFGPVLQLSRPRDLDAAIAAANDTVFGLAAGLLSDHPDHPAYVQPRLRAGIVNINRPLTGATSALPFGGPDCSGNYRPSAYYAADYCAYPVASLTSGAVAPLTLPGCPSA